MSNVGSIEAILTLNATGFTDGLSTATTALNKFANATKKLNNSNSSQAMRSLADAITQVESTLQTLDGVNRKNLNTFSKLSTAVNNMAKGLRTLQSGTLDVDQAVNTMNSIFKAFQGSLNGTEVRLKGISATVKELSNTQRSGVGATEQWTSAQAHSGRSAQTVANEIRQRLDAQRQLTSSTQQLTGSENQLQAEATQTAVAQEKVATSSNKASASMTKQASATRGLGKALSSLRMMGTMVGSMIAYNFVHNLAMATTETINAKSEMNGYFQMLGYTTRQTEDFNRALDRTVEKFPRLNKYALGETISSIGVEFELTTKEMKKAMPVVSMITSEYLRAGRNVNEASLAVKDILQGEFQRLSRETGVKAKDLKEAGWSGDKTDVMGLLKALDKVGKARNWDTFVQKANSLNDAVLILQNRFSEWSADMVERIQPTIVGVFNTMMSVAGLFADSIEGVADWLGGEGLGQSIVKWGGLATALGLVVTALIRYRTGATLTQIAQMGLTKSIGASILGLEAETVAQYGLRNAIVTTVTGIEAETLANEENIITRRARLQAIASTITGYEMETVASKGVLKSLIASSFGAKESTLSQYGLSTAVAEATTQMEAQKLASMSLAQRIALIGATTIPAIAVVGAFAVAFGKLVLETKQATDNMAKFYDIQQHGTEYVEEAKDSVKNLKSHIKDLKKTQSEYAKGSVEYKNVGKAIDDLNSKMKLAKQNAKDNYEALQIVNSAQENYDTTKQELQLELQRKINQSLVDTGLSTEEANELSNTYLNDAIDGAGQLYKALQSVSLQYDKEAKGVASLTDYWSKKGLSPDEIKVKIDPYIDSQNAIVKDIETMKTSTDLMEVTTAWLKLQVDQIQLSLKENLPKIEAGDWAGGITGLMKGLAHGLADLPVFGEFWDWVFRYTNVKERYGGKGWEGLSQWIDDSLYQIFNTIFQTVSNGVSLSKFASDLTSVISNFFNDPLGALGIDFSGFDLVGSLMNAILPDPVSASDGSSDHPSFMQDISNILGFDIQSWITNFNTDPLGTLGIQLPQIDIIGLITSLIPIGGEGGFDIGAWLGSIFNIDGIVASFTSNLNIIFTTASTIASNVSGVFNNLKNMIWGHIQGILSNVTSTFTNIRNVAVNQVNGLSSGIKSGIDKVVGAFNYMKDAILNSARAIYDGVKSKFDSVKNTIGDFWHNLTNPSSWGSAGSESYQRRSPKPQTARRMFSPVIRSAVHHGAGVNPYKDDSQSVKLKDLMGMIDGDNKVRLSDFLSMFTEGGFGAWDFHEPVKKRVFDTAKGYKTGSPSIQGIGTVGDGYKVEKFWDGKPKFSFDEFQAVARAIFSAIPYKFYYDSEWKGNWVNALLSGAVNCSDGADALIALARVFGFDGYKQHTTLKNGVGHFFAVIGGKAMDTTNFQNHGSWSPLGGAGIPTRTSTSARTGRVDNGKTVNITNDFTGAVFYGVDDFDSRVKEVTRDAIREEFNDPYTVAL